MQKPTLKKYEKELLPPINMPELKKWVTDNYGKKCPDYSITCSCCIAHRILEDLKQLLKY